jgi:hypothetical protein
MAKMGRPRLDPDRWKANVVLRIAGFSNLAICRLLGETNEQVLGRNYKRDVDLYFPELLKNVLEHVKKNGIPIQSTNKEE